MECKHVSELLPWYLNETLPEGERADVEHHLAACPACGDDLGRAHKAFELFNQHLPSRVLVDYAADGEAAGWETSLIENHLRDCEECSMELTLTRQSLLQLESREKRGGAGHGRRFSRFYLFNGLAAVLIAALGVGWLMTWQDLQQSMEPQAGYRVVDLFPQEAAQRSGMDDKTALDENTNGIAVTLHSQLPLDNGPWRLEIRENDRLIWEKDKLHRDPDGRFTLILPATMLPEGALTVLVYSGDEKTASEHYRLLLDR
ncbi:MAG: zf-HC2 domain-containing protein [Acidobacteriota bacterium]|nr:zf-HC2 domain-containing protein [Acidobacteriota bacterium]